MPGGSARGRETPLPEQTLRELWWVMVGMPLFGGLFVSLTIVSTLVLGRGPLPGPCVTLLVIGFFWPAGIALVRPRLGELGRRGAWVPPGTATAPMAVTAALVALFMAASGGVIVAVTAL